MENINCFLLGIFILLNGLKVVKPASILGEQEDKKPDLLTPTGVQTSQTNVQSRVDVPPQGAEVLNEYPSNVERKPMIDNGGLYPNIPPLSDPVPENVKSEQGINTDFNNQLGSSGNEIQAQNVVQPADNTFQTDINDRGPSQTVENYNGQNRNEILSAEKQYQSEAVVPIQDAVSEKSAQPLDDFNELHKADTPVNGAASLASENSEIINAGSSQTKNENTQNKMPVVVANPVLNENLVNENVDHLQGNNPSGQIPVQQGNIEPTQDQTFVNEVKPLGTDVSINANIVPQQSNFIPVQKPIPVNEDLAQSNIEPIQEQMSSNMVKPVVTDVSVNANIDQSDTSSAPVQNQIPVNVDLSQGNEEPVQDQTYVNNVPGVDNVATDSDTKQLDGELEEIVEAAADNDYYNKDTTTSSSSSSDYDDDDYDDDDYDEDDEKESVAIINTNWWNNSDDQDDLVDDDEYYNENFGDDDDETWEYWESEEKTQISSTTPNFLGTSKSWKAASTTAKVTTDDSVDAGKGLMESVHHFDNNFGPFAGAKVSGKSDKLGGDGFAYTWTLLVSFCVVLICLFVFWNRHKVEKYIVSLRQTSPSNQNRGMLSKDEEKNLLDNEYT